MVSLFWGLLMPAAKALLKPELFKQKLHKPEAAV
jgi:hypothetical protein